MANLPQRFRKIRQRVAVLGVFRTLRYLLASAADEYAGIHVLASFRFPGDTGFRPSPGRRFGIVRDMDGLDERDLAALRAYGGDGLLREFRAAFARGEYCAVGREQGALACVCWIVPRDSGYASVAEGPVLMVMRCFTLPAARGRGFYPETLRYVGAELAKSGATRGIPVFIEVLAANHASIRGIRKAGCEWIGTRFCAGRLEWFRPAPCA